MFFQLLTNRLPLLLRESIMWKHCVSVMWSLLKLLTWTLDTLTSTHLKDMKQHFYLKGNLNNAWLNVHTMNIRCCISNGSNIKLFYFSHLKCVRCHLTNVRSIYILIWLCFRSIPTPVCSPASLLSCLFVVWCRAGSMLSGFKGSNRDPKAKHQIWQVDEQKASFNKKSWSQTTK